MTKFVNENIDLDAESIVNLAKCTYFFLRDNIDTFTVSSDLKAINEDSTVHDLNEHAGRMLLDHLGNMSALHASAGDVIVSKSQIVKEAVATLHRISSEATVNLLNEIVPGEHNSDLEIYRTLGSVLINEVIIKAIVNAINISNRKGLD